MTNLQASESEEQQALFEWAMWNAGRWPELNLMFHIPNEGKRSFVRGAQMRAEGLKKGVPDIFLPAPRGQWHGLFVELKRVKGSTPSIEQEQWFAQLQLAGYAVCWARGWERAKAAIVQYLTDGSMTYRGNGRCIGNWWEV